MSLILEAQKNQPELKLLKNKGEKVKDKCKGNSDGKCKYAGIKAQADEYVTCQKLHYKNPVLHPKPHSLEEYLRKYPDIIKGKRWFRFVVSRHTQTPWIQQGNIGFGKAGKDHCSLDCKHSMLALAAFRSIDSEIDTFLKGIDKKIENKEKITDDDKDNLNKLIEKRGGLDTISAGSGQFKIEGDILKVCLNTKSGHYKPDIEDCKRAIPMFKKVIYEYIKSHEQIKKVEIFCQKQIKNDKDKGKKDAKKGDASTEAILVCQSGACFTDNLVEQDNTKSHVDILKQRMLPSKLGGRKRTRKRRRKSRKSKRKKRRTKKKRRKRRTKKRRRRRQ